MYLFQVEKKRDYLREDGSNGLLLAVFFRTIGDYLTGDVIAVEDVSGQNGSGIFSFSSICSHFRLNRAAVKRKLDSLSRRDWEKMRWRCEFRVDPPASSDPPEKLCPTCGSSFRSANKFCSPSCVRKPFIRRNEKRNKNSLIFGR